VKTPLALLLAGLVAAPLAAAAQDSGTPPPDPMAPPPSAASSTPAAGAAAPLGVVVNASLGGGGSLGGASEYTRQGLFEAEVAAGWEVAGGFRPELALALGVAPRGHVAFRPGLRYAPPELPFYARAALDFSTVRGTNHFRWLLAGAGAEVRLTDVLGGFAEADFGFPFTRHTGLGFLVRAGVSFRF
jgi:hypothetical protein